MLFFRLSLSLEQLEDALADLQRRHGVDTLALHADVSSEADVIGAVGKTVATFGRIHALVNNAGIRMVAPAWETDTETWDRMMAVNLRGEFLCTREVLRQSMLEQDDGRLIFISSITGRRGTRNSCAYSATKWGILGLRQDPTTVIPEFHLHHQAEL